MLSPVTRGRKPPLFLMAEDDAGDRLLALKAMERGHVTNEVHFVEDGEELLDYLYRRGDYEDPNRSPRPAVILLDLNMPRKDGREVLEEVRRDPQLRHIPIVVLTTSDREEDVYRAYYLGASSYITKPPSFDGLVAVMQGLRRYWLEVVQLPTGYADA
jgi:CheY-like chemotaxis protein